MKVFTLLVALCATLFSTKIAAQPTDAPTTPPTRNAADVMALFTEAYTPLVSGINWTPNWSQAVPVTITDVTVAGNVIKKYENLSYQGTEFTGSINVSSMQYIHVDLWTANCASFDFHLISPGLEPKVTKVPTLSGWNSYDIPLTSYSAAALNNIIQFKFVATGTTAPTASSSVVYLDNIYFWKPANVPTITGFSVAAKTVGDPTFDLTAPTSPSAGAFTYTSSNTAVATISGVTVTVVGAGTSTITCNQAADGAYAAGSTSAVLIVETPSPTTAAPTPTRDPSTVTSMFSGAYTDIPSINWDAFHGSGVVYTPVTIAGDAAKKFANLSYLGAQTSAGMDLTSRTHLHLDVWTYNAETNFRVKLVNFASPNSEAEVSVSPNTGGGVWKSYDIDLSTFPATLTSRASIQQFIISSTTAGQTFWVDNVYFYTSAVATEPTTAATTPPARGAATVISLFSNAYTDLASTGWEPTWGQSTGYTEVAIATNPTKKYTTMNYQGIVPASTINASGMEFLHLDVWTPNCTSFEVFLINPGPVEQKVTLTPTLSGWNSFNIPLSSYNTTALNNIFQLKLVSATPYGTGTVYIDNLYFYTNTPATAATTPTLPSANVISLYSDTYTNLAGIEWNKYNGGTGYSAMTVAGNATQKYTGMGYSVTQLATPINTVNATHLHLDVWAPTAIAAGVFKVKLVDYGADGTGFGPADNTEGEVLNLPAIPAATWTALDIPLADFMAASPALGSTAHIAQFIPSGGGTVFMDNIYFYANAVLAVELSTVKAKAVNNTTVLTWQTASEKDNAGFTIERSADATNFTAIGNVKGNGTTNTTSDYTFTDATPLTGVNYYRLRQADFNGKESFSKVVSVAFGKNVLVLRNTLVQNTLEVTVSEAEKGPLSIFNVSGQLVFSATVQGTQVLDVSSLTAGMYIVRMGTGAARRFVKQ